MKYVVIINYPITGRNYIKGFAKAADALDFLTERRAEASEDRGNLESIGAQYTPRTITFHEAIHLTSYPETIFRDMDDDAIAKAVAEESGNGA